jgi:hypothetical protein
MKKYIVITVLVLWAGLSQAQEITKDLESFSKIVVSPKVNLILEKGDKESVRLAYSDVTADKINIVVKGNTLKIYLTDARVTERTERVGRSERRGIYRDVTITAYVTYKDLKMLEIRGDQELTCNGPIAAKKFRLKAYGENEIRFASINTEYFKTTMYGQNDLKVKDGKADFQKYKLFGENKIDTQALTSYDATTNIYGESKVKLTTQGELRVTSFGESEVSYNGNAKITRGLILGRTSIAKLN